MHGVAPPKDANVAGKPAAGYVDEYVTAEVLIVRIEPTADASLAAIRDRSKFGIAIAAIIKIIATTINNSISEKPFCFDLPILWKVFLYGCIPTHMQMGSRSLT